MTHPRATLAGLTLGSIGVVYGDIGTSPLYAFRESLAAANGSVGSDLPVVLGLLSLILWSLFIIVTLKYVMLLLKADNQGEGGILSLMALAKRKVGTGHAQIALLGIIGASLFYGDAVITPAISVLSAVEGLKLVTDAFTPFILPVAIAILIGLFWMQARGTENVSRFFGPIMVLWFLSLAWGGLMHIGDSPVVWQALNPMHGFRFLEHHGLAGAIALGAVVLAITGAEALYADLGHFGRRPIKLAWFGLVFPSLALNYIGQAALVLHTPEASHNSFFMLYPEWALPPMVMLATVATVIAGQAVITGAYSLTHQAIQLGLLPRLHVKFTSETQAGQVYIPQVNWLLLIGVVLLVAMFRNSSNLASAYGIAVTGTMLMSTCLAYVVIRHIWRWHPALCFAITAPLLLIDLSFLAANMTKLLSGGYMPVLLSLIIITLMQIWIKGSNSLHMQIYRRHTLLDELMRQLNHFPPTRVEGTAVFLTGNVDYAPMALLHNIKHNKVLHDRNILLTLEFTNTPHVRDEERIRTETVPHHPDFLRVYMRFGYMEPPNVIHGIRLLRIKGTPLDMMSTSFFISRRNIVPSAQFGMPLWQDRIYISMTNHASDPAEYFHIPHSRVVELGVQMTV